MGYSLLPGFFHDKSIYFLFRLFLIEIIVVTVIIATRTMDSSKITILTDAAEVMLPTRNPITARRIKRSTVINQPQTRPGNR